MSCISHLWKWNEKQAASYEDLQEIETESNCLKLDEVGIQALEGKLLTIRQAPISQNQGLTARILKQAAEKQGQKIKVIWENQEFSRFLSRSEASSVWWKSQKYPPSWSDRAGGEWVLEAKMYEYIRLN